MEAGVDVLPVIIRETHGWKTHKVDGVTLGKLNALPASGKPVPDWPTHDKGWANIAAGIERLARELMKQKRDR